MKSLSKALAVAAFLAMASGAAAAEAMSCCGEKCACCDKKPADGAPKDQGHQHQHQH